eukprot:3565864-Pleurochrysis_carterae.AAC.1
MKIAYQSRVSAMNSAAPVTHSAIISSSMTSALGSKSTTETRDQLGWARASADSGKLSHIRPCTLYKVGISRKIVVDILIDHSANQKRYLREKRSAPTEESGDCDPCVRRCELVICGYACVHVSFTERETCRTDGVTCRTTEARSYLAWTHVLLGSQTKNANVDCALNA